MAQVDNCQVVLNWAGQDVSAELAPFVKSISFIDSIETGSRDEVSITLNNRDGRFINEWFPAQGDILKPGIAFTQSGKTNQWNWGQFAIDKMKVRFAPNELKLSALAQELKRDGFEKIQHRSFDNTSLQQVVDVLASESGLTPVFTGENISLTRLQLRNESPQQALIRLAKQYQRHFAVKNGNLLFLQQPNIGSIEIDLNNHQHVKAVDLDLSPRTGYEKATIEYYDAQKNELITHTETAAGVASGKTLTLHQPATDLADAKAQAKAALEEQNKDAGGTSSITLKGVHIEAGMQLTLIGAGQLPGKWLVEKVTTTIDSQRGWDSKLQLRVF